MNRIEINNNMSMLSSFAKMHSTFSSIPNIVAVFDEDRRIIFMNKTCKKHGLILGQSIYEQSPSKEFLRMDDMIRSVLETGEDKYIVLSFLTDTGDRDNEGYFLMYLGGTKLLKPMAVLVFHAVQSFRSIENARI